MSSQIFTSKTPDETFKIGLEISSQIKSGDIFLVNGGLGAGKSVLIRGIAKGLGVTEDLPSPTFTIVNEYSGKFKVYHFDLYRIDAPYELYEIGFEDYIYSDGVSFIEWPSKCGELLPEEAIEIDINIINGIREIVIKWKK